MSAAAGRFSVVIVVLPLVAVLAACGSAEDTTAPTVMTGSGSAGAASTAAQSDVELAPELEGISDWYNTEPLTLADLRGRAVLLVFWSDT
jgi:hypothetical protein